MFITILALAFGTIIVVNAGLFLSEMLHEEEAPAVAVAPCRRRNRSSY